MLMIFIGQYTKNALPSKTLIYIDTGFKGVNNLCPDLEIRKPKKKRRDKKLNGGKRLENPMILSERVKV